MPENWQGEMQIGVGRIAPAAIVVWQSIVRRAETITKIKGMIPFWVIHTFDAPQLNPLLNRVVLNAGN